MLIELIAYPGEFSDILSRKQTYMIRIEFKVHDILRIREMDQHNTDYTGREIFARVVHVSSGLRWGLPVNLMVAGIDVRMSLQNMKGQ